MSGSNIEQRALSLVNAFEKSGRTVASITIDGKKIELVLSIGQPIDEFDKIGMRHDKT
ncbi:hypothetical protein SAMN04488041_101364 [Sulfitobacter pontiacus]|uniref:Uncharacterized protein n=1 Tax=Sulfitobacter pontiacus TaxID=60137 RepID=A0A1H2R1G5_9RHOB|nr:MULTISPECIES: hypothetical protein [Sulfitobacter]QPO08233.1 hypothetical protein IT972_11900 [Sulfitobacter sp. B30-2]SDW13312.1 hypothetical protein SAMN04488041_101364 [Sulfitobacter pontiacus]|tara:strand:- start:663 stop:836 length:174 start_codon:yes stop_codon:yes gene_type:complete